MSVVLYLKIDKNNEVKKRDVTIGDVAVMYCEEQTVLNRVRPLKLMSLPDVKKRRVCLSTLSVIELITKTCPGVEVNSIGESDFIVDYMREKPHSRFVQCILITFVALFTFIGSMFAIMAYNNDVATSEIFEHIYDSFAPQLKDSLLLEISYAAGVAGGIIVFYNHFAGKRFGTDPTPIEVEMDKYDDDVDTALIDRSLAVRNKRE